MKNEFNLRRTLNTSEIDQKQVFLIGFVKEIEVRGWGKGIAVSTGVDGYVIEVNEVGDKLRNEVENDIEVTGIVTKEPDGKKRILATDFMALYKAGEYNLIYDEYNLLFYIPCLGVLELFILTKLPSNPGRPYSKPRPKKSISAIKG